MSNIHIPGRNPAPNPRPWHKGHRVHSGGYDAEMDLPAPNDPRVRANLERIEREQQFLSKSSSERVEMALMAYEKNYSDERTKAQRWHGQERWQGRENEEMRLVRIMHPYTFMEKLARSGVTATPYDPFFWYRQNKIPVESWPKPHYRIWLNAFTRAGRIGVNAVVKGEARTVTTIQYPYGPEWSIMRFNEYDVPTNEKYRGWRTTLLCLIVAGVITEAEAHKAFGSPVGEASLFYREQLFNHRAINLGLAAMEDNEKNFASVRTAG